MSNDDLTLGDAARVLEEVRAATAIFSLVMARRDEPDQQRNEFLEYLAKIQYLAAAPTLVIELARGTPLTEERTWMTEVCRLVAADERIADVAPRLAGRFLDEGSSPGSPLLDESMVGRILDAESANLAELDARMPDLQSRAARILAGLDH